MGIKIKSLQRKPYSPIAASALRSSNNIVLVPPSNAVAIAAAQSFTSLATNALATASRGLTNPILLNGTGIFSAVDPNSTDSGVYIPIPLCPVVTFSNGAGTGTFRWRGVNHLGRPITITETKSQTVTTPTFYQCQAAFSVIDTVEVLSYTGAGADTFTIGYIWDFGVGTGVAAFKRIPMPYSVQAIGQVAGMNIVELGGAVWAGITVWAAGDLISATASADLQGYTTNPELATVLFNMGRTSTNPATPFRLITSQTPHAKNTFFDDAVPTIIL